MKNIAKSISENNNLIDENKFSLIGNYSRFVRLMKLSLFAIAIALSMVLIIWTITVPEDRKIEIYLDKIPGNITKDEGMINGRFMGQDSKNNPYIITAKSANPSRLNSNNILLKSIQADLTLEQGNWLTLISPEGTFVKNLQKLNLSKSVFIYMDNGLELNTKAAEIDLANGIILVNNILKINSPYGEVKSDSFRFFKNTKNMLFSGNVQMIIKPEF